MKFKASQIFRQSFFLSLSFLLACCSSLVKAPESASHSPMTDAQATAAYARVLEKFVNKDGEIDFEGLSKARQDLNDYVAFIARKDLSTMKDPQERLAYLINSYNALSMFLVIEKGIPKTNAGFKKVGFFYLTKLQINQTSKSLVDYEKEDIRSIGEDRIHWALNCMAVSCPRLPQTPFTGAHLEKELTAAAKEFFNSSKNVKFDDTEKTVYLTQIFDFFPKDFVPHKAPNFIDYVNLFRDVAVPTDYKQKFIDYDWTVNNSNRSKTPAK